SNKNSVSIICPLYNKSRYVTQMIESVIIQDYINWELIIVDDGSTDGSLELVQNFLNNDRIKLIKRSDHTSNKGASVARNIGIKAATGNYVIFLDADDLLAKKCLELRFKAIADFPDKDYYIFNTIGFKSNTDGFITPPNMIFNKIGYKLSDNKRKFFLKCFCKYNLPWNISSVLWKTSSLRKLDGFNEKFQRLQDPELHIRALIDDALLFKSFLYGYPEYSNTICIRLDDDRRSGGKLNHFKNHVGAVSFFLYFFVDYLKERNQKTY